MLLVDAVAIVLAVAFSSSANSRARHIFSAAARSRHRQCLGSNRPSVTRYTALLALTQREHARALHAAFRFCARRTDGGRRSPSCGRSAISLLEQGRMQH